MTTENPSQPPDQSSRREPPERIWMRLEHLRSRSILVGDPSTVCRSENDVEYVRADLLQEGEQRTDAERNVLRAALDYRGVRLLRQLRTCAERDVWHAAGKLAEQGKTREDYIVATSPANVAEGDPRWRLACGNPANDPYCAECTERYRAMVDKKEREDV